jgi:signal transduction histidine kinase
VIQTTFPTATELHAAVLLAAITLGLALVCGLLYHRYRKPYLGWLAVAWLLYLARVGAIASFLATHQRSWLYWHQVLTGWTALALLWAALVFSRQLEWRRRYALLVLFPLAWSYVAIYRLDNFLLAAGPAVLFLSLVTLWTGGTFLRYYRRVRATGAALLSGALLLWGLHHLDYPFLRARGAWSPWGYYLDILFLFATGGGILMLVQDELRRGVAALSALSGDLQPRRDAPDSLGTLLQRPLALPTVLGSAMIALEPGGPRCLAGAGACAGWPGSPLPARAAETAVTAIRSGRPAFLRDWPDPRTDGRHFPYAALLPVWRGGAATGALLLVGDAHDPFTALDETFLRALGSQIGAALENADLYRRLEARTAELARLSAGIVEQQEAERRRLSLELHDETAQVLTAVKLQLGLLAERLEPELAGRVAQTVELIDTGMQSVRRVTEQLRPSLLDDLGLLPALRSLTESFAARAEVTVSLDAPETLPALGRDTELALFRATQEALSNVARHAAATTVRVRLANGAGRIALEITDDGRGLPAGFDLARVERDGHLGLVGMRERIAALGGTADISGAPGAGVRLRLELPLASPEAS